MCKGKQDKFEIYGKSQILKRIKRGGFTLLELLKVIRLLLRQSTLKGHKIILSQVCFKLC